MNIAQINKWALMEAPEVLANSEYQNIIIDLRNNFGGDFDNVIKYLYPYLFSDDLEIKHTWYLPDTKYTQKIVSDFQSYRTLALKESSYSAQNGLGETQSYLVSEREIILKGNADLQKEHDIYVLISENTASAADKLAAILKDNTSAMLIGTNTAGEGRMSSFLVDYLSESGLLFAYMPELAFNSDDSNNAIFGTAPNIYVKASYPDEETYVLAGEDPYTYENRLKWDAVLIETLEIIQKAKVE